MSYCGKGDVPKGKKRGSIEHCLSTGQVRHYGKVAIGSDSRAKRVFDARKAAEKLRVPKGVKGGPLRTLKQEKESLTMYEASIERETEKIKKYERSIDNHKASIEKLKDEADDADEDELEKLLRYIAKKKQEIKSLGESIDIILEKRDILKQKAKYFKKRVDLAKKIDDSKGRSATSTRKTRSKTRSRSRSRSKSKKRTTSKKRQ